MSDLQDQIQEYHTVIVGGGITGLYCAMKLVDKLGPGHRIGVFEASPRFGGRIETAKLDNFICEFGPMRFELDIQPLLNDLLEKTFRLKRGVDILKFPAFATVEPEWPKYTLRADERTGNRDYNALELTKLALIRIFKGTRWASKGDERNLKDPLHDAWLVDLYKTNAYDDMRRGATFNNVPLWSLGFWNVFSDVLSHQAVLKIRDTGNFYHLIPDNPNAVEWIIFWLRGLIPAPMGQLWTIKEGSASLTDLMLKRLAEQPYKDQVHCLSRHTLTEMSVAGSNGNEVALRFHRHGSTPYHAHAKHVILAIPRSPLMKLASRFTPATMSDLDAVFGFPLLKIFFTATDPWWRSDQPVHTQADKLPTRELHYQRRGDLGMIMLYTDRPASEYWKMYIKGATHEQAEINGDERIKGRFAKYLAEKLTAEAQRFTRKQLTDAAATFSASGNGAGGDGELLPGLAPGFDPAIYLQALEADSVDAFAATLAAKLKQFGIRDWSREPYGGACHTWQIGAKSIEVLDRLKAFRLDGLSRPGLVKNVHVCGEAYCDYNGFIEGSFRSAVSVIGAIPKGADPVPQDGEMSNQEGVSHLSHSRR